MCSDPSNPKYLPRFRPPTEEGKRVEEGRREEEKERRRREGEKDERDERR